MPAEFEPYTKLVLVRGGAGFGCKDLEMGLEKDQHQDQNKHLEDSS